MYRVKQATTINTQQNRSWPYRATMKLRVEKSLLEAVRPDSRAQVLVGREGD